ncbi:MAG TPA: DUF2142 domain-containing protein [Blastocatellia bacterium]|nr:DUF2142 domain-containing protein [Blastocatellia bacterium]
MKWLHPLTLSSLLFVFGIVFIILTPPFQVPDEPAHFFRAFHLSEGVLASQEKDGMVGGMLPVILLEDVKSYSHLPFNPAAKISISEWRARLLESRPLRAENLSNREFANVSAALYSPAPYIPQILAIWIGRLADFRVITTFYLGRLLTLAFAVSIIWYALCLVSYSRQLTLGMFCLIGSPMSIFQMASLSADAITNAAGFLIIAACFALMRDWSRRTFYILLVGAALISLCKSLYALVALFGVNPILASGLRKQEKVKCLLLLFAAAALPGIIWFLPVQDKVLDVYSYARRDIVIDPGAQIRFILDNPIRFLSFLYKTLICRGNFYFQSYIGLLGWIDTKLSVWTYTFYPILTAAACLIGSRSDKKRTDWKGAGIAGALTIIFSTLLILTMFMYWNPVGDASPFMQGIQGRYFIPILPMILLSLPILLKLEERAYGLYVRISIASWVVLIISAAASLAQRYWG